MQFSYRPDYLMHRSAEQCKRILPSFADLTQSLDTDQPEPLQHWEQCQLRQLVQCVSNVNDNDGASDRFCWSIDETGRRDFDTCTLPSLRSYPEQDMSRSSMEPSRTDRSMVSWATPSLSGSSRHGNGVASAHIADLQHQVTLKSLALQTLQSEYASLLQKLQRERVKSQAFEKKFSIADAEVTELNEKISDLTELNALLTSEIQEYDRRRSNTSSYDCKDSTADLQETIVRQAAQINDLIRERDHHKESLSLTTKCFEYTLQGASEFAQAREERIASLEQRNHTYAQEVVGLREELREANARLQEVIDLWAASQTE